MDVDDIDFLDFEIYNINKEEYEKQFQMQKEYFEKEFEKRKQKELKDLTKKDVLTLGELLQISFPKKEWLIKDLIEKGSINLIGGDPASFKSFLTLFIAVNGCFKSKQTLLEQININPMKTLLLDEENRHKRIKERIKLILEGKKANFSDIDVNNIIIQADKGTKLASIDISNPNVVYTDKLLFAIEKHKPNLIIVDSLVRFMESDENSTIEARKIFDRLKFITNKYGCSWIILHHTRKGNGKNKINDVRGSGDFIAMVDNLFMINKSKDGFTLSLEKSRDGLKFEDLSFIVKETENGGLILDSCDSVKSNSNEKTKKEQLKEELLKWFRNKGEDMKPFSADSLAKTNFGEKYGRSTIYDSLKELKEEGFLVNENRKWIVVLSKNIKK
ncbi:AAA family ATPase [bacterium]|nr:AAA family ATPase [bacterium]